MDTNQLKKLTEYAWEAPRCGAMRVPGVIYGSEELLRDMDEAVLQQVKNVAALPGIQVASFAMPDAHWGYGFPIGGVAAFDPDEGGVVSAGGVGFDISCGVRMVRTDVALEDARKMREELADALFGAVPAGVGSTGALRLNDRELNAMLEGGAQWAVKRGYGTEDDLARIEHGGAVRGADPEQVSETARKRQRDEMGTLGSGNHYAEVQYVEEIYDPALAGAFRLQMGDVMVSVHCGSRGLGHQVATDFSRRMVQAAGKHGIAIADRELACAPIASAEGQAYLGAMRSAINCALANRQILTHLVREVFSRLFKSVRMPLFYDVSHNTCSEETHEAGGRMKRLFVHRKGATRAFGPGRHGLPPEFAKSGQPVLIGGTMGTASYVLAGCAGNEPLSFGSACHGAGRAMSRNEATRKWQGGQVRAELERCGICVRAKSYRGLAEEAPGAYKDVDAVVECTHAAGLARKVARLRPVVCVKG